MFTLFTFLALRLWFASLTKVAYFVHVDGFTLKVLRKLRRRPFSL